MLPTPNVYVDGLVLMVRRTIVFGGAALGTDTAKNALIHSIWIRYDNDEAIVGEAGMEITVDENICLLYNIQLPSS